jgi:hypothetical protein
MDVDTWIEGRILWKAGQNASAFKRTYRFADLAKGLRERLATALGRHAVGRPVLAFIDDAQRWTVLGTAGLVSRYHGGDHRFRLRDLTGIDPVGGPMPWWSPERVSDWKAGLEYLCLWRSWWRGTRVWGPPGAETFALWNTLLMFPRIYRGAARLRA